MAAHTERDSAGDAARVREDDSNVQNTQITDNTLAGALEAGDDDDVSDGDYDGSTQTENDDVALSRYQRRPVNKTDDAVALRFFACLDDGLTCREAAIKVGIHLRTAQRLAARCDADAEVLQEATRKLMTLEALDRVDDWRTAARVGAAKRGNHLPAKDWLLHAGIIEPLQGENQAGIRIAINIGTDDRPMKIVSPIEQKDEE